MVKGLMGAGGAAAALARAVIETLEDRRLFANSVWAYPGANGDLLYLPTAIGDRVEDFSTAGYKGGNVAIPFATVRVTLNPDSNTTDDTSRIQLAIDQVEAMPLGADGLRGAVLLTAGEYQISGTLNINASGVVLRGQGSSTVLRATGTSQRTLVEVQGGGSRSSTASTTKQITNKYVPVGARSFTVEAGHTFAVGDNVVIFRPSPQNWIEATGMHLIPDTAEDSPWTAGSRNLNFERIVTRVDGNVVTIDAPLTNSLDAQYGGGTISKYTWSGGTRIENVGVESIDAISDYNAAEVDGSNRPIDDDHANQFVDFEDVQNGWMRYTNSKHFRQGAVKLETGAKWITVEWCTDRENVSVVTGGNRYPFNIDDGQQCLVRNCYSAHARHAWVVGQGGTPGPNVFVDDESNEAQYADDGPHQRWSVGGLYDNVRSENQINIRNRWDFGSGHGWAGANFVVWNAFAEDGFIVQNPPTAQNWLIGSSGSVIDSDFGGDNPPGHYDQSGPGAPKVAVRSLYYWQLQQRAQYPGAQYREISLGDIDRYTRDAGTIDDPAVDPAWNSAVSASLGVGATINGFDEIASNQWIPFTFNFTLEPGRQVVGASLSLGIKSSGGTTSNDLIHLDSIANSFTFAQLGSTQPGASDGGRVLDLGTQLALLQDGKLNVAIQNDSAIDWAVLNIQTAPLAFAGVSRNPEADAHVRDGASAATNFGAATTLETQLGSSGNTRESFLRFDLIGIPLDATQIKVRLMPITVGGPVENTLSVVSDTTWNEGAVNYNNRPAAGTTFASFIAVAGQAVEVDVTAWAKEALLRGDTKLSLKLASLGNVLTTYGSRTNGTAANQPQLLVVTPGVFITDIPNQRTSVGTSAGPIAFTIGDDQTPANSLTLSATSSNPALLPVANIVFGGSGNNRTVTLNPIAAQQGTTTITITVNDGAGQTDSTTFTLVVANSIDGDQNQPDQNDLFRIVRNGALVDVFRNGVQIMSVDHASGGALIFNMLGGTDTLQVDMSGGNPIPVNGVQVDGGSGQDLVSVIGSAGNDAVSLNNDAVTIGTSSLTFLGGLENLGIGLGAGSDTVAGNGVMTALQNVTLNIAGAETLIPSGTLPAITDVNVAAGGTFDLGGGSETIDSLDGAGVVINNGAAAAVLTVGAAGGGGVFTGRLRNGTQTLSLSKNGGGTLTLGGDNDYTGVTTFNAGTIASGNALSLAGNGSFVMFNGGTFRVTADTQSINLANKYSTNHSFNGSGGTFEVDLGVTFTIGTPGGSAAMRTAGGSFSGGGFTKTGAGTLRIVSNNGQQDDPFILAQGGIVLEAASGLGGGDAGVRLDMMTGTTLMLRQDAPTNFLTPIRIPDASSAVAIGVDRLTPGPGVTHQIGAVTALGGLAIGVDIGSANVTIGTMTLQIPSIALGGEGLLSVHNASPTVLTRVVAGAISGPGGVQKLGDGALVFAAANTYAGATSHNEGTIQLASIGALPATTHVQLGGSTSAATLDMNGFSASIASLSAVGNNATGNLITNLNAGQNLTVNGNVLVGGLNADGVVTKLTVSGGGTFAVNNPAGTFVVDNDATSSSSTHAATLDLSGLTSFTADVDQLLIGVSLANNHRARGVLTLAANNNITARAIVLGRTTNNSAGGSQLNLGQSNTILANTITLATGKGNTAEMKFRAGFVNPSVTISDKNTGFGADLLVGFKSNTGTASPVGTVNFVGGTVNATLNTLTLGWQSDASGNTASGHFSMSAGNVVVNNLTVGWAEDASSNAAGTVNVSGGTLTVNGGAILGRITSGASSAGTLNITGGAVVLNNGITDGGGASTINLDGGSLDLTGDAIGSAVAPINSLTFASGALSNLSQLNGGAPLAKTTAGVLTLAGVNSYTGATIVEAGTLLVSSAGAVPLDNAVTINNAGTYELAGALDAVFRLGALTINASGVARVTAGADAVLIVKGLAIAPAASLSVGDSDLLWDYAGPASPYIAMRDYIVTGRDNGVGGIVTSGPGNTVLAPVDNVRYGATTWSDIPIDGTTIIGKYTYYGDANLDGKVDSNDYVAVDVGLGVGDSWVQGDFNFSGSVTSDDYVAIDTNLGSGTGASDPLATASDVTSFTTVIATKKKARAAPPPAIDSPLGTFSGAFPPAV